jgi:hypothetical protein
LAGTPADDGGADETKNKWKLVSLNVWAVDKRLEIERPRLKLVLLKASRVIIESWLTKVHNKERPHAYPTKRKKKKKGRKKRWIKIWVNYKLQSLH